MESSIRFTVELESNAQLPFLDVLLRDDPDGSISTSVYRNPTHTDRYLDFSSHLHLAHKIAVVRTLHTTAESINSSVLGKDEETKYLRQVLTSNGFPEAVVHRYSMQSNLRMVDRHDGLGQGQGVGRPTPSPPETNPGVHPH